VGGTEMDWPTGGIPGTGKRAARGPPVGCRGAPPPPSGKHRLTGAPRLGSQGHGSGGGGHVDSHERHEGTGQGKGSRGGHPPIVRRVSLGLEVDGPVLVERPADGGGEEGGRGRRAAGSLHARAQPVAWIRSGEHGVRCQRQTKIQIQMPGFKR